MEEGDESVLEEVLLHLGVGGEGKQTRSEMRPTKENLEKVQKKRQFVRFTSRSISTENSRRLISS